MEDIDVPAQPEGWHLDKRVPLALIAAVLLQTMTAVWWASAQEQVNKFQDQRLITLEKSLEKTVYGQELINDRLARIEERVAAQLDVLKRIEQGMRK